MAGGFPEWRYDPRISQHVAGSCSGLTPRKGRVLFQMTPGTAPASANGMYIGEWANVKTGAGNCYFSAHFSANNEVTLTYVDQVAGSTTGTWDCTASLVSGTAYEMKIEYNKTFMKLYVDNDLKITLSVEVDFGSSVPNYCTLGTNIVGGAAYTSTTYNLADMKIYDYQDGSDKAG